MLDDYSGGSRLRCGLTFELGSQVRRANPLGGGIRVLLKFNIYDLYILSFVQLILATVLVLSPARELGTRFRWTGSRITEIIVGGAGAVVISAVACVLTHELWGVAVGGLETAAIPLVITSVVVMTLQPDRNLVGQVFYASFGAAALTFIG